MARDFEDIDDVDSLPDEDLRDLIRDELRDYDDLDTDRVEVDVEGGVVTLSGRVGTEEELQEIEHIVTDVIGARNVTNDLVVDELVRAANSEAADEAAVQRARSQGTTGGGADRTSDEAEHLLEDTAAEQFGTSDTREAIERGYSYDPPDHPIQEGSQSRERH